MKRAWRSWILSYPVLLDEIPEGAILEGAAHPFPTRIGVDQLLQPFGIGGVTIA